jgi:Staphylococcal nuclease homologue
MHRTICGMAALLISRAAGAAPIPACTGHVELRDVQAVRVEKNAAVILADGQAIHPEGLLLPAGAADRSPDFLASQALNTLSQLVHDRLVTVTAIPPKEDRYGRLRGQVFISGDAADPWLQVAMLKRGMARVSFAPDRHECAAQLLAAEAQARAAKTGLWAYPAYVVRSPQSVARDVGLFELVEGKVVSAAIRGGHGYLDFGADWSTDFTVTISPDDMANFAAENVDPRSYAGKTVLVRGWVEQRDGPDIEVAIPQSIQIVPNVPLRPRQMPGKARRIFPDLSQFGIAGLRGLLQQHRFDALDGGRLVGLFDGGDFARHAGECGFVKLALGIGLLRLTARAVQVAHDLGDRDQIARVDLGFVFLRAARPHGALDAGAALQRVQRRRHDIGRRQLAHAYRLGLGGGNAQRHLVLVESDDEQFELEAGDFLLLDLRDPAHTVGRVDDMVVGLEIELPVRIRGNLFLGCNGCGGHISSVLHCAHIYGPQMRCGANKTPSIGLSACPTHKHRLSGATWA